MDSTRASPVGICVSIGLFLLTVAMVVGVLPQWLILYLCSRFAEPNPSQGIMVALLPGFFHTPALNPNPSWEVCSKLSDIQEITASWMVVSELCLSIPALLLGPFYGSLSDRVGRKPMVLLGMTSVTLLSSAYIAIELFDFGLWILLAARVIVGFLGGLNLLGVVMMSYFADTTSSDDRNSVFVIGQAVTFAGAMVGPLIGGIIARKYGAFTVIWITTTMGLFVLVGTALYLPESLQSKKQDKSLSIRASLEGLYTLFRNFASPTFLALILAFCLQATAAFGDGNFFYYMAFTFGWDPQDEGQFGVVAGISRTLQLILVFPLLNRMFKRLQSTKLGKAYFDLGVIRAGALISAISYFAYAMANSGYLIYFVSVLESFGNIAPPVLNSLLSLTVGGSNQGLLFSGIGFLNQCIGLLSRVIFPNIWKGTINTQPNAFLLVIAGLYFATFLVLIYPSAKTIADCASEEDGENESLLNEENPAGHVA